MNKTTIVGVLIFLIAVLSVTKDILTGEFSLATEKANLLITLNGLGFVFGRAAIQKVLDAVK